MTQNTPKEQFHKRPHHNLVQSIRMAESHDEIMALIALAESFEFMSKKTAIRVAAAATKRQQELWDAGKLGGEK